MQLIPAIDLIQGICVRLYQGDYEKKLTYAKDPVEQALKFQSAGFRRIHLVDLEGARSGTGENREVIRRVIEACRVPVQVGGGIRSAPDVESLLEWGADFLILSTAALEQPKEVEQWLAEWGCERFIVSLDLRDGRLKTDGWLEESSREISEVVGLISAWGLKQVICTDTERDGTLAQPNYTTYQDLIRMLSPDISLIAAGGVSSPVHIQRLKTLGVGGAIIGRALYEGKFSWEELIGAG